MVSSAIRCPVCANILVNDSVDNCRVQSCSSCKGMWISANDLNALVKADGSSEIVVGGIPVEEVTVRTDRRCPYCMSSLSTANDQRTKTQIDWCRYHGVWLDASELDILRGRIKPSKEKQPTNDVDSRSPSVLIEIAWFFGRMFI